MSMPLSVCEFGTQSQIRPASVWKRNNSLLLLWCYPPTLASRLLPRTDVRAQPECGIRLVAPWSRASEGATNTRPNDYCCSKQIDMFVASCWILATHQHAMHGKVPVPPSPPPPTAHPHPPLYQVRMTWTIHVKICGINCAMQMRTMRRDLSNRIGECQSCRDRIECAHIFVCGEYISNCWRIYTNSPKSQKMCGQ